MHNGGSSNSGKRTLTDIDMSGEELFFYSDKVFRSPHGVYPGNQLATYIDGNPFNISCDTRAQIENLYKKLNFQDKCVYQECNSFLEYRFGNNFHKSCVEWVIKHILSRPYLANIEIKDDRHFFIDGHGIYKFDENSYLAYLDMLRAMVKEQAFDRHDKLMT